MRHEGGPKPEAWVFDRGDGVPPTMSQLRRWFEAFCRRHALERGIRIHDMRGAVASALANAGETVATAQQALGHSNVITTLTYYNLAREGAVKKGMNKLFGPLATASEDGEEGGEGGGEGGSHQKSHQIGEGQPVWHLAIRTPGTHLPARNATLPRFGTVSSSAPLELVGGDPGGGSTIGWFPQTLCSAALTCPLLLIV